MLEKVLLVIAWQFFIIVFLLSNIQYRFLQEWMMLFVCIDNNLLEWMMLFVCIVNNLLTISYDS
jgi:hypothetical protein